MRHRDLTLLKRIRRPVGWLVKCCFCCFLFMLFILAVYAVHQLCLSPIARSKKSRRQCATIE